MAATSCPCLRIFLSYSEEQGSVAEQVYLKLITSGHHVFFDRTSLPPGDEFDNAILTAIRSSDFMVFLISPQSIRDGAYTRTELRFARDTWPNPNGRVLPVIVVPTDFQEIPNYLTAVTILQPEGDVSAEIAAAVNDFAAGHKPEETVTGQVQLIKDTTERTEWLERKQRAAEIDRQWESQRARFSLTVNGSPVRFRPSPEMAILPLLGAIALSLFNYFQFTRTAPDFFGWMPTLAPLGIGFVGTVVVFLTAQKYRVMEMNYRRRRDRALAGQDDDAETFLRDLTKR